MMSQDQQHSRTVSKSKSLVLSAATVLLTVVLVACSPRPISWTEEVDLGELGVITVNRHETYTSNTELGGLYKNVWINESTVAIEAGNLPMPDRLVVRREFPLRVDFDGETREWYALTYVEDCYHARSQGLGTRPYLEYRWRNSDWLRQPIGAEHVGKSANLLLTKSLARKSKTINLSEKQAADRDVGLARYLRTIFDRLSC